MLNAALASVGTAAGGLLMRGTLANRIGFAVFCAVAGLVVHFVVLAFAALVVNIAGRIIGF
jgi:hypothetical protein